MYSVQSNVTLPAHPVTATVPAQVVTLTNRGRLRHDGTGRVEATLATQTLGVAFLLAVPAARKKIIIGTDGH